MKTEGSRGYNFNYTFKNIYHYMHEGNHDAGCTMEVSYEATCAGFGIDIVFWRECNRTP